MVALEAWSKNWLWFYIDLNLKINRRTTGRLLSCSQDCRSSSSFLAKFLNSTASSCDDESEQEKLPPLEKKMEFEVQTCEGYILPLIVDFTLWWLNLLKGLDLVCSPKAFLNSLRQRSDPKSVWVWLQCHSHNFVSMSERKDCFCNISAECFTNLDFWPWLRNIFGTQAETTPIHHRSGSCNLRALNLAVAAKFPLDITL